MILNIVSSGEVDKKYVIVCSLFSDEIEYLFGNST